MAVAAKLSVAVVSALPCAAAAAASSALLSAVGGGAVGASHLGVDAGGRQTVLVVAGTIFKVAFQLIVLVEQLHALCKGGVPLEEGYRHLEYGVLHGFGSRSGLKAALELGTLNFVHAKLGPGRSTLANVGRVDVPARLCGTSKNDVDGGGIHALVLDAEVHLSLHGRHGGEQEQKSESEKLLHYV